MTITNVPFLKALIHVCFTSTVANCQLTFSVIIEFLNERARIDLRFAPKFDFYRRKGSSSKAFHRINILKAL